MVGHEVERARSELVLVGDLDWTGPTAQLCADVVAAELRALHRLRAAADDAARAVLKHAAEVHAAAVHDAGGVCR